MAVFFCDYGDHPEGFVGYRVATTLGKACDYKQKYFSANEYGLATGSRLAHELDAQWRACAMDHRRAARLTSTRSHAGPGALATGLIAMFLVARGKQPHHATSINPVFVEQMPGYGKGQRYYSIKRRGFDEAFSQAVDYYGLIHGLDDQEKNILLTLKPKRDLFINTLRLGLLKRGIIITASQVKGMLEQGEGKE